jgi:molybdate transport system regulatory protein
MSLRISGALTVETGQGTLAGKRWIDLLAAIEVTQSISAAARSIGLSYKAAWDAVEAMNNLADAPLVERSVGGKGGGGTRLTPRGQQLIATFRTVEQENARFLDAINTRLATADRDLALIGRLGMLTSARNHFAGTVGRIQRGAVNDEVELRLRGGESLFAIITRESTETLGLHEGVDAVALVKASWIIIGVESGGQPMRLSARNRLAGTVAAVTPGAVNSEVVIQLPGGQSIAAIITNESLAELALEPGRPAVAYFKASSVILGIAG